MRSGLRRRMDESDNRQKTRYERERARKKEVTTAVAGECRHTEKKKEKTGEKATRAKFNPRGSVSGKRGHAPRNRLLRSTELAK